MEMQTFNVGDKECVALVRKLTPRECFHKRLEIGEKDISNTITSVQKGCMIIETYDTDKTMP